MTASAKMDWMLKQWILVMEGLSVWQKVASVHLTHSNKLVMIRKKWYLVRKTTDHCFYMPQNERTRLKEGELFLSWEFKNWRWDLYLQRTFCCWCEKENILIQGWGSSSIEAPQILHASKGIALVRKIFAKIDASVETIKFGIRTIRRSRLLYKNNAISLGTFICSAEHITSFGESEEFHHLPY